MHVMCLDRIHMLPPHLTLLLDTPLRRAGLTLDFLRLPDQRTEGALVLCPCSGADLARLVWGWSQCLKEESRLQHLGV